jgi:hypothetical protein
MAVGQAFVEIGVDFKALRESLSRAKAKFSKNAKAIERDASKSGKNIGSKLGDGLSSGLKLALAGVGAFIAGNLLSGVASKMREIIDLADDIGKSSKRIGLTVSEMQKLSHAATLAGADMRAVEVAMRRMSVTVLDASNGLAEANRSLNAIGISVDELEGKTPHQQFELIAQALNEIEDAGEKAAVAQKIFGRSGTALIPMLDNYKALGDELERVGGIMSGESIKAAEDFNDALADLAVSAKAAAANSGLITWLSGVADGMNQLFKLEPAEKLRAIAAGLLDFTSVTNPLGLTGIPQKLSKLVLGGGQESKARTKAEIDEAREKRTAEQLKKNERERKRAAEKAKVEAEKAAAAKAKADKEAERAEKKKASDKKRADAKERRESERELDALLKEATRITKEEEKARQDAQKKREKAKKDEADAERERLSELRQELRELGNIESFGLEDLFGSVSQSALDASKEGVLGAAGGLMDSTKKAESDKIKKAAMQQVKNQETQIDLQRDTIKAITNITGGSVFSND